MKVKCINAEAIKIETSEKAEALINAIELSKLQQENKEIKNKNSNQLHMIFRQENENAELKKALELACYRIACDVSNSVSYFPDKEILIKKYVADFLQQAKAKINNVEEIQ